MVLRRPERSVECSDSEKKMSACADQNHAPSLTCVRLEFDVVIRTIITSVTIIQHITKYYYMIRIKIWQKISLFQGFAVLFCISMCQTPVRFQRHSKIIRISTCRRQLFRNRRPLRFLHCSRKVSWRWNSRTDPVSRNIFRTGNQRFRRRKYTLSRRNKLWKIFVYVDKKIESWHSEKN